MIKALSSIGNIMTYRDKMIKELKKTDLALRSQEAYFQYALKLFNEVPSMSPGNISEDAVEDWLIGLKEKKYAAGTIRIAKNGVRFFFEKVIPKPEWRVFQDFKPGTKTSRRPCLTVPEVWTTLNAIRTPHNKAALTLIYLCGLRLGECLNLGVCDVLKSEQEIHIHWAKGAKERNIPIPVKGLDMLRDHYRTHRHKSLLFPALGRGRYQNLEERVKDVPMPSASIQTVFKAALKEVGIQKRNLSVHSLRHSYATHLLELGVPIEHVKQLMGHSNLMTTARYLHITPTGFKETKQKIENLAEPMS
jgi:integrase/recombinase XerD